MRRRLVVSYVAFAALILGFAVATAVSQAGSAPHNPGDVWVNLKSKVYHKEGDVYYGKTKEGKYMSEADAIKAGYREAGTPKSSPKP